MSADIIDQIGALEAEGIAVAIGTADFWNDKKAYQVRLSWSNIALRQAGGPAGAFSVVEGFDSYADFYPVFESAVNKIKKKIVEFLQGGGI